MYISREMLPSKGAQRAATHHAAMHDKCKKKNTQNHPDLVGEKLVSLQWDRWSQTHFICVFEVGWKLLHPSSLHPKMPTWGNSIDLMGFTQFLLKREVGTTDFQRKADSAWWASTQSWNPNTSLGNRRMSRNTQPSKTHLKSAFRVETWICMCGSPPGLASRKGCAAGSQPCTGCWIRVSSLPFWQFTLKFM